MFSWNSSNEGKEHRVEPSEEEGRAAPPLSIPGQPPSPTELGNSGWNILHSAAAVYPYKPSDEQKEAMGQFIHGWSFAYACNWCAYHMRLYLKEHPPTPSVLENKHALTQYMCRFHNRVNEHLNKPQYDCDNVDLLLQRWHPGYPDKMADRPSWESRMEAEQQRLREERQADVAAAVAPFQRPLAPTASASLPPELERHSEVLAEQREPHIPAPPPPLPPTEADSLRAHALAGEKSQHFHDAFVVPETKGIFRQLASWWASPAARAHAEGDEAAAPSLPQTFGEQKPTTAPLFKGRHETDAHSKEIHQHVDTLKQRGTDVTAGVEQHKALAEEKLPEAATGSTVKLGPFSVKWSVDSSAAPEQSIVKAAEEVVNAVTQRAQEIGSKVEQEVNKAGKVVEQHKALAEEKLAEAAPGSTVKLGPLSFRWFVGSSATAEQSIAKDTEEVVNAVTQRAQEIGSKVEQQEVKLKEVQELKDTVTEDGSAKKQVSKAKEVLEHLKAEGGAKLSLEVEALQTKLQEKVEDIQKSVEETKKRAAHQLKKGHQVVQEAAASPPLIPSKEVEKPTEAVQKEGDPQAAIVAEKMMRLAETEKQQEEEMMEDLRERTKIYAQEAPQSTVKGGEHESFDVLHSVVQKRQMQSHTLQRDPEAARLHRNVYFTKEATKKTSPPEAAPHDPVLQKEDEMNMMDIMKRLNDCEIYCPEKDVKTPVAKA